MDISIPMGTLAFGCLWQWDFLLPSLITRDVQRWETRPMRSHSVLLVCNILLFSTTVGIEKTMVFGCFAHRPLWRWKPLKGKHPHGEAEPSEALRAAKEASSDEDGSMFSLRWRWGMMECFLLHLLNIYHNKCLILSREIIDCWEWYSDPALIFGVLKNMTRFLSEGSVWGSTDLATGDSWQLRGQKKGCWMLFWRFR